MTTIPKTAAELTADWFTDALDVAGGKVADVSVAPLGVGVGLVGQLYRCELTWDGEAGPHTVIAKLAAEGDESRFVALVLNMYGREVGFYEELSSQTNLSHPRCFYAAHDAETQDTILLLEDVSARGAMRDQVAGCSLDDVEGAIRLLARFHAGWWEHPRLLELPWLKQLCEDPYPAAVSMAFDAAWPNVQQYCADQITPEVKALGDGFVARIPDLFAKICEPPLTLSHADYRLDNLFFADDGDVIAVDWQLIDRSCGPRDLAYLVTQSLNIEDPADFTRAFDIYLDALASHGIETDRDHMWEMYRYATHFGFVYPIVAGGALTINDPRHLELCSALLRRCLAAMQAVDAFDLPL